jgi:2',3'-cyclic-nucleotide 2'-phosphodiesterase (5'-nucleotidase family)
LVAGLLLGLIIAGAIFYFAGIRSDRMVTILAINDVYRLDGVAAGKSGGLPRVRTLRRWIEREAPNALLLHAGDFLSPSLESKVFKGAQMIDVLNNLDGAGAAFDTRMFVAFGNHEFDDSRCDKAAAPLNARVAESQFTWLVANLDFSNCPSMNGMLSRPNVRKDGVIIEVDGIKVGLFGIGLTPDKEGAPRYPHFKEALPAARRSIAYLRQAGAQLIVALTHLPREDDEALLKQLSAAGLGLVVGGHDHTNTVLFDDRGQARGFKADSDARTAWRIDVAVPRDGRPRVDARLITLNEAIAPDPALAKGAQSWSARAEQQICADRGAAKPDCLSEPIGRTRTTIDLEEIVNRTEETAFGDWLADLIAKTTGADVAIVNSGILGLNEDLAPGTELRLRHLVDIFRFDDIVAVRSFPAKQVCAAMAHGLVLPGMGGWPHVSGVEVEVKRTGGKYQSATVTRFRTKPGVDCDSAQPVKVVSMPFLLCGGDGYALLPPGDACLKQLEDNPLGDGVPGLRLSAIAEKAIRAAGNAGIAPMKDGRVRFADTEGR